MNTDEKSRYFQELSRNLRYEGLTVKPETEKGLLSVELDGQRLCLALDTGAIRYWKEDVADDRRSAALDRVTDVAKITAEYMRQMEVAPQLTASGLTGDYRLLAEFNDTVLAGHPSKYGIQFVTWEWVQDHTALYQGNYTGILLKPGYYNMSEYIEDVWAKEGESWNERHPYVQLRKCYDGVEVVIRRVDGLSIHSDNENLTEIVVEPRYAQVLNFEECHDITLSGLTMGHTETGACSGDVLDFYGCRNINLSAMDIYGCGVYGIACYDGTGELYVYSSTIRDCAYGALNILDGNGRFELHNCGLTGSSGYDQYVPTPYSELAFYECVFGVNETSYYMFHEDIYTEDCVWSENYEYPEALGRIEAEGLLVGDFKCRE